MYHLKIEFWWTFRDDRCQNVDLDCEFPSTELPHEDEMNGKVFSVGMYLWDNANNIIKPISSQVFHGQLNVIAYI
jgi:hypothetical protein